MFELGERQKDRLEIAMVRSINMLVALLASLRASLFLHQPVSTTKHPIQV
jgi:hypothetical protein